MISEICVNCTHYDGNLFCEFYGIDCNARGTCTKFIPTVESLPQPVKWNDCGDIDFLASIKELRK